MSRYLLSAYYVPSPGFTRRGEHGSLEQLEKSKSGGLSDRFGSDRSGTHKPVLGLEHWMCKGRKHGAVAGPELRGPRQQDCIPGELSPCKYREPKLTVFWMTDLELETTWPGSQSRAHLPVPGAFLVHVLSVLENNNNNN